MGGEESLEEYVARIAKEAAEKARKAEEEREAAAKRNEN
jgi:hypothetical protein